MDQMPSQYHSLYYHHAPKALDDDSGIQERIAWIAMYNLREDNTERKQTVTDTRHD